MRRRPSAPITAVAIVTLAAFVGIRADDDVCTILDDATTVCPEADDVPRAAMVPSSLQSLIDAASPGDTIVVDPGTYVGTLTFHGKDVTLRSSNGPEVTILEGTGGTGANGPLVDIGPYGALIGFTIQKGRANVGAGLTVHGAGSVIQGNIFQDHATSYGGSGVGISGNSASPRIEGNTFRRNSCEAASAGVVRFVNYSSPTIVNNVFEDNSCYAIKIVLPVGNVPVVINNTIVRNPVGIYVDRRVNTNLHVYENNAIVGNGTGFRTEFGTESNDPIWKNNLLFGNSTSYAGISDQTGRNSNISSDPQFIDLAGGDYHVILSSPALDAGDSNAPRLPSTDYDGEARVRDGNGDSLAVVDIGADEYTWRNRRPVAAPGSDQTLACQGDPTVAALLDGSASTDPDSTPGTNDDIVAFDWFENFGSPLQVALGSGASLPVTLGGGTHYVTLRVTDQRGAVGTASLMIDVRGQDECDDGNPCTADSVTSSCGCNHRPTPDRVCDDGNACTSLGLCDAAGVCLGQTPVNCIDGLDCTRDSCDPAVGCVHSPVEGSCDDFNPCTEYDTCVGTWCRGVVLGDGKACDDRNDCTASDVCTSGQCRGAPVDNGKACDDHNACTLNEGCYNGRCYAESVPDGTSCDDANACTTGERCRSGSCVGAVPFVEPLGSPLAAYGRPGVGDFNLDGNLDLVTRLTGDNSRIATLLGDGTGRFTQVSSVSFAAESYPALLVVADFNLDGRLDFAAVQQDVRYSTIVCFLGDGAGGFVASAGSPIPVDPYMRAFVTGDFNNDGRPDVAAASQGTKKVAILLGDGTGGFASRTPVAAGPLPQALAAGDFNRDGKLDVAAANPVTYGGVTVLLGDGAGGLSPFTLYPAGSGPSFIAVGDLNQDGDQDLAVSDSGFAASTVLRLRGDGTGGFSSFPIEAGRESHSIAIGDLDLDGQPDLVVGFYDSGAQVLLGDGTGYSFPRAYGWPYYFPGQRVQIVLADLDRDGRPDVIASGDSPAGTRILLNRSVGRACPTIDGCATNVCDRTSGACTPKGKSFGSACDDHNVCTTNDSCIDGWCQGPAVTGLSCDDGTPCTTGDTCDDGVCSGTSVQGPQDVDSSVRVSRLGDDTSVTWNPASGATTSSVLRGVLVSLPVGSVPGDETCLASRLPATALSALDNELPQAGSGYWYLVRGENACRAGSYGQEDRSGLLSEREAGSSCP